MQSVLDQIVAKSRNLNLPRGWRNAKTLNSPMSDEQSGRVRDEATEFAARLLENYAQQLAHRRLRGGSDIS